MVTGMIREFLKHNKTFRTIFAIPIAVRRRVRAILRRGFIDKYKESVVGGQIVLNPRNIGGFFKLNAVSDLAARVVETGEFEPEITEILLRLRSMSGDIVNIGANVGFYSVFFAKRFENAGKVYAIEPNPEAFSLLEWNIVETIARKKFRPYKCA